MSTDQKILLVDDEQALLDGLCRRHRREYTLVPACGPTNGLRMLAEDGPFAVVVTDYRMPAMNGVQFLAEVRKVAPAVIPVMLTGQADLRTAIDAVNKGNVFRFLTKPCEAEDFRRGIDAALEQYALRDAERSLLESTVRGSIEVLAEVLALASPAAFGKSVRLQELVRHVVQTLQLPNGWKHETAALLSQIGCVAIPDDVIARVVSGETLTPDQTAMMEDHPELARDLLQRIPRLQPVAEIVYRQRAGASAPRSEDPDVELGGRVLAAAHDFEDLLSLGATAQQAIHALKQDGGKYDPRVLGALATVVVPGSDSRVHLVTIARLRVGMILEDEVRNTANNLILPRGHVFTPGSLLRLRNYVGQRLLPKSLFRVRIPRRKKWSGESRAA
ncbi:MAG: HD domain-containing phosphohydrolase [Planctomycetota bacterium]